MSNNERYDLQLKSLVHALSQSITEATDDEIAEDARASGVDLDVNAAQLKQMFSATAKSFQKRKFIQAQQAYNKEVHALEHGSFNLPTSPAEQRVLLQAVVAQQTQSGFSFTAKFRDFENLSDSDVASLLEELAALGLVPNGGSNA